MVCEYILDALTITRAVNALLDDQVRISRDMAHTLLLAYVRHDHGGAHPDTLVIIECNQVFRTRCSCSRVHTTRVLTLDRALVARPFVSYRPHPPLARPTK